MVAILAMFIHGNYCRQRKGDGRVGRVALAAAREYGFQRRRRCLRRVNTIEVFFRAEEYGAVGHCQ